MSDFDAISAPNADGPACCYGYGKIFVVFGRIDADVDGNAARLGQGLDDLLVGEEVGAGQHAPLHAVGLDQLGDLQRALLGPEELVVGDVDRLVAVLLEPHRRQPTTKHT